MCAKQEVIKKALRQLSTFAMGTNLMFSLWLAAPGTCLIRSVHLGASLPHGDQVGQAASRSDASWEPWGSALLLRSACGSSFPLALCGFRPFPFPFWPFCPYGYE